MSTNGTRGRANVVIGIALVGAGLLCGLTQFLSATGVFAFWPFFIIFPGLLFFVGMALGGRPAGPLAIPGSIVTTVGLLLLYQATFNQWQSWAYAWSLIFPTAVGLGLIIHGKWSNEPGAVHSGMRWAGVGLVIFLILGAFFELLVFNNMVARVMWPLLLIGFGIFLLLRRGGRGGRWSERGRRWSERGRHAHQPAPTSTPVEAPPQKPPEPEFEPIDMKRGRRTRSQ